MQLREVDDPSGELSEELEQLCKRAERLREDVFRELSAWEKVQLSRHPDRPYFLDHLDHLFEDFVELHGDRVFGDDPAIVAGFASFEGQSVAVIGQQKGRTTKQKLHRNFGMAHPEGYRKASRVMAMANRFGRPVITFIDTPGAYPGLGAEERGQSEAIGTALLTMAELTVPVVTTVIGEGGSGGALGIGVANHVLMLEYATYSVITPEGCASILWRDGAKAPQAAAQLRLLAEDARRLGICDEVVAEPPGGAHRDHTQAAMAIRQAMRGALKALGPMDPAALREHRYQRFRALGRLSLDQSPIPEKN